MKNIRIIGIVIAILLMCNGRSFAQVEKMPNMNVRVVVSSDEGIKPTIESYIKRELRSLSDVTITDAMSEWEIGIIAILLKNKDNTDRGTIAISAVLRRYSEPTKLSYYYDNLLVAGNSDTANIHKLCSDIVIYFDTSWLEITRRSSYPQKKRR